MVVQQAAQVAGDGLGLGLLVGELLDETVAAPGCRLSCCRLPAGSECGGAGRTTCGEQR